MASYSSSEEENSDINDEASAISVDQSSVPSLAVSEPFWLGGIGEYEEEVDSATVSPL